MNSDINFAELYKKATDFTKHTHDRIRFINTFWLKLIAIITMTIDHGAVIFGLLYIKKYNSYRLSGAISFETYEILRSIGRIAFPIFCFMIVEGYFHTRNIFKYGARLFTFAIISQIPFSLMLYSEPYIKGGHLNVYFTLFLGLAAVAVLDYFYNKFRNEEVPGISTLIPGIVSAFLLACAADFLKTDYGFMGVLFILLFYIFRNHPLLLSAGLLTTIHILSDSMELYGLIALIPIFLYNGKKGPGLKYFFYLYYPLHMLLLYALKLYMP